MGFNRAYEETFAQKRMTMGLLTPAAREPGRMASLAVEERIAAIGDALGFAALWTRDVPLLVPQGSENEANELDDPFLWLAAMGAVTKRVALGTSAIVLPLRPPLLVAKQALSLNRLTGDRLLLGLGSGDRPEELRAFGVDLESRGDAFRDYWRLVRSALSTRPADQAALLAYTGGYGIAPAPESRIPMLVVGSARQSLQWIAANSDGWATYHRDEPRQQNRMGLWTAALAERAKGERKPFIQSLHLELLEDPHAPAQPRELGITAGRHALGDYLVRLQRAGVAHVLVQLARTRRNALEVVDELGREVLPRLQPESVAA